MGKHHGNPTAPSGGYKDPNWARQRREEEARLQAEFDAKAGPVTVTKRCTKCGQTDGPYPNGDRPKSTSPLVSGCSRCGSCF